MPRQEPKAEGYRVRPDWYVQNWRRQAHQRSQKAKAEALKLHASYRPKLKRIVKDAESAALASRRMANLTSMFAEDLESLAVRRVEEVQKWAWDEGVRIIDMMLPKGAHPEVEYAPGDFWNRKFKGVTPKVRLAHLENRMKKRMASVGTVAFREAEPLVETVEAIAWDELQSQVGMYFGEQIWQASLQAYSDGAVATDVMSHWEHLATLDDRTCDECAALDGQEIPAHGDDEPWALVDIHPWCRCVPVPVSKTWEELGFEGIPEPEGTRIARTDETGRASPTGYKDTKTGEVFDQWRPGLTPVGGNQYYEPAGLRYMDWAAKNPNYAGDWFIPPGGRLSGIDPGSMLSDAVAKMNKVGTEQGFTILENGNIVYPIENHAESTRWSMTARESQNCKMYHTHPSREGAMFSPQDFNAARAYNASETTIGLANGDSLTILRPPGGWPTDISDIFTKVQGELRQEFLAGKLAKPETLGGYRDVGARFLEKVADELGTRARFSWR